MPLNEASGYLTRQNGHRLYWERHGTFGAEPVFFLHGGPGGCCSRQHLGFFDLRHFDVILLDQRGCGRSRPHGQRRHNNSRLCVQDIEALRLHFGLEQISLLGISWGSWLAIQYQQQYRCALRKTTLVSIFVPFPANVRTFDRAINAALQVAGSGSSRSLYHKLDQGSEDQQRQAAMQWLQATLGLNGQSMPSEVLARFTDQEAIRAVRLELHYHLNRYFFSQADENLSLSSDTLVIQGVKDTYGMSSLRWLRQRQFVEARLLRAGHNAFEPAVLDAVRHALRRD